MQCFHFPLSFRINAAMENMNCNYFTRRRRITLIQIVWNPLGYWLFAQCFADLLILKRVAHFFRPFRQSFYSHCFTAKWNVFVLFIHIDTSKITAYFTSTDQIVTLHKSDWTNTCFSVLFAPPNDDSSYHSVQLTSWTEWSEMKNTPCDKCDSSSLKFFKICLCICMCIVYRLYVKSRI